jgi:hypothetical protein
MMAAMKGHIQVVKLLIRAGANMEARDKKTPMVGVLHLLHRFFTARYLSISPLFSGKRLLLV